MTGLCVCVVEERARTRACRKRAAAHVRYAPRCLMCVCACVCCVAGQVGGRGCICVCVRERERAGESTCVLRAQCAKKIAYE